MLVCFHLSTFRETTLSFSRRYRTPAHLSSFACMPACLQARKLTSIQSERAGERTERGGEGSTKPANACLFACVHVYKLADHIKHERE